MFLSVHSSGLGGMQTTERETVLTGSISYFKCGHLGQSLVNLVSATWILTLERYDQ